MKKIALLFAFFAMSMQILLAQTKEISGTVTSADDGSPIPGASVSVKGTTLGTITDMDGNFHLKVPTDAKALVFSFVGMATQEVAIGAKSTITVQLKPEAIGVDEVVVTAVGIKRESKALGYGVQTIKNEEITRVTNSDVVNSLSAKAAGVQVNSSGGTAGASSYITIRGAASILGNNQPLFVVDGLPIISGGGGGDVDGVATSGRSIELNPEEIESMTILKGGAATALYGLQAANGAIIITTKKGNANNRVEVNFSSSVTVEKASMLPPRQNTYTQGSGGKWSSGTNGAWGYKFSESAYSKNSAVWTKPLYDVYGAIVPKNSPYADASLGAVTPFDAYDFFQTGLTYNNNLSISSGNEKNKFFLSIGNYDQEGIVPNNTFDKTNIRFNASTKLNDKVEVGGNTSYIHSSGNFIQQGSNTSGIMLGLLRTPPSFDNSAGYKLADGTQRTYRNGGGYDNPYWVANEITFEQKVDRFMGNLFFDWQANNWFSLHYSVGTDLYTRRYQDYFPVNSAAHRTGQLIEYYSYNQIVNSDLLLNFKHKLNDDIDLRLTLGHNLYGDFSKSLNGQASGLSIPGFVQLSNTSSQTTGTETTEWRTMGVFGDLQIDYKSMLYIGLTGRNDWSTTMPEDNLSAFYPSANIGFIFSELGFLKDNPVLSYGKLRSSWAKTANIADPYGTQTYFVQASAGDGWTDGLTFPLLGYTGFTWGSTVGNTKLQHELQTTFEVGTELKFLKNRIGFDIGYFKNKNEKLLLYVPIAASTGYAEMYMNAATMESYGWEISLNATPIKTKNLSWDLVANFTKIKNPVTKLAEGVPNVFLGGFTDPQIRAVAGEEYRTIYGYDWIRDADGNVLINDDPNDSYRDGFPMTDESNMVALGSVNPDWLLNITNTVNYKGFSLSFLLDIKAGGNMYNGTRFAMNYFGTSKETEKREVYYNSDGTINMSTTPAENLVVYKGVLGHLDSDGNVVSSGIKNSTPVVNDEAWYKGYGSNFGGGPTSAAIDKTDWVRLREISLSYSLNKSLLNKTFLKSAQVYVSGKNLWLKTPYKGVDPETSLLGASNAQGMDYFNMPGSKSVTIGLRVGF